MTTTVLPTKLSGVAQAFSLGSLMTVIVVSSICIAQDRKPEGPYKIDKASVRQQDVPQGRLIKRVFKKSRIFPGTEREYAIYVPAQYKATNPACLMVVQDGMRLASEKGASRVPIVFDNLIHSKEMPVTIGVFVNPGVVPAQNENAQPRFNRSLEYDAIDDRYVRFLLQELLPEVTREFAISKNPNDRAICGSSSGGIAAFNVAWQRPDQFRRVYTMVGTYIGLRGANEMSVLVRKTEPKPLRVFLQDGSNDLNIYCGDWWVANQAMLSALQFNGYEVDHVWGKGYHGQKHGGAIFPQAMRSIWKDWPNPVKTHYDKSRSRAPEMLVDGEGWNQISDHHISLSGCCVDKQGDLFVADAKNGEVIRIDKTGKKFAVWSPNRWAENKRIAKPVSAPIITDLAIGPDGSLYGCAPFVDAIIKFDKTGSSREFERITDARNSRSLIVANDGTIYFTRPDTKTVWMKVPGEPAKLAGEGFSGVTGIAFSTDQTLVYVSDKDGRYVWSCVRQSGGTLTHLQPYFHIHSPPASVDVRPHSDGIAVDQDGWVLVATKMGIQICDQPGRVNLILPLPTHATAPTSISFGGLDLQTIYVTSQNKVYSRKVKLKGAMPWDTPVKPKKPRL